MLLLIIIACGILNFATRFSMIGLLGSRPIPPSIRRLLEYTAPAVLAAIIAPAVLLVGGEVSITDNPRIIAFIGASITALLTHHVLATIGTGMGVLWILDFGFV